MAGMTSIDVLIVKAALVDDAAAGFYGAAQNLARVPYFLLLPAAQVLFPAMAESVATGDRGRLQRTVAAGLEASLAIVVPISAVLAAAPALAAEFVFGAEYVAAGPALRWLGPALGILALASTLATACAGMGHPRGPLAIAGVSMVLQIVLGFTLADRGIEGVAVATLTASCLCLLGQAALIRRYSGTLGSPRRLALIVGAGVVPFMVAQRATSPSMLFVAAFVGLIAYVAVLWALRVLPKPPRRPSAVVE